MSREDYISIGSAPAEEDCAQVGSDGYMGKATKECERYKKLLRKKLGSEPEGARLATKSNSHDFGTYLDVVCYFDPDDKVAVTYALDCEGACSIWEDDDVNEQHGAKHSQEEIQRRAERALFDGVVEAWCKKCRSDLCAEPDADTCFCDTCGDVVEIDNPCMMLGII